MSPTAPIAALGAVTGPAALLALAGVLVLAGVLPLVCAGGVAAGGAACISQS